jgi:hypothetical protein
MYYMMYSQTALPGPIPENKKITEMEFKVSAGEYVRNEKGNRLATSNGLEVEIFEVGIDNDGPWFFITAPAEHGIKLF